VPETRRLLIDGKPVGAVLDEGRLITEDGQSFDPDTVAHLPPVAPSKILCVHLNYRSRVEEFMTRLPAAPTYFQKPTTALNAHLGEVVRPERCRYLNFEGEIAIVIGKSAFDISPAEAAAHVAGYTIANDFGLHDFRDTDAGSMLRVKGSDTLCPVGPGLVTDWDFRAKEIRTLVNGEVRQSGRTTEMEWDMHYLVADIARTITLLPGDVILSGTPAGSRPVEPGDVVEVEVEGLGSLINRIIEGDVAVRPEVGAQPSESEEVISTAMGGDWELRGVRAPRGPGAQHHESELDT
jgi:5-oxopent-3-ene-1,2,5-tricarboxylate decarboxylase/2-hydroxyhepta-2,4-diene-1,7-dioate isomerase